MKNFHKIAGNCLRNREPVYIPSELETSHRPEVNRELGHAPTSRETIIRNYKTYLRLYNILLGLYLFLYYYFISFFYITVSWRLFAL